MPIVANPGLVWYVYSYPRLELIGCQKWSLNIESFRRRATLFKSQTFVFSDNGYVFYQIYWPADTMIVMLIL